METAKYLEKLHRTEMEIVDEIDRICVANNLRYFLVGGTLLGAVRHGGFIPWDDDMDVAMPRPDYEKFLTLCETQLGSDFFCQSYRNDEVYVPPFAKVKKNGTKFIEAIDNGIQYGKHPGIWVDIFPLDYAKKQNGTQKMQRKLIVKLRNMKSFKLNRRKSKWYKKFVASFFSHRFLSSMRQKVMTRCKKGDFYVNLGSRYDVIKQTMPISVYEPAVRLKFEDREYMAPADYKYVLNRIYGDDYMSLPPEEKRVTHEPVEISFGDEGEN